MGNFRKHSPRVFWSEAEVSILMEHYPSLSAAELLEKLPGRTIRVIQCKANGLGLSRTKPKKRTTEQTREAKRKHMAERRAENPEAMRAVSRNFHRKHKERINAQRRGHHVTRLFWTRALKFRGVTASDLAKLWKAQRGLCALTGRKMDRSAQVDHKLPLARGGKDDLSNLQWATAEANRAKRDLTDIEFHALCTDSVRWIGERIARQINSSTTSPHPAGFFKTTL